MGNKISGQKRGPAAVEEAGLATADDETPQEKEEEEESVFEWPDNFYVEARDSAAASFLVYSFAYILDTARQLGGLDGLAVEQEEYRSATGQTRTLRGQVRKPNVSSIHLQRSFTPREVIQLIQNNSQALAEAFPSEFQDPTLVFRSLQLLQDRVEEAESNKIERPLTLQEFDDRHQQHELVYGITVDQINKRILLVFRGTDNELAFSSDWSQNLSVWKQSLPLPSYFNDKNLVLTTPLDDDSKPDTISLHQGFYKYLFETTLDDMDDPNCRKYDEILQDVQTILARYPHYKLYVTGHSLGGALATLVSFFLACDEDCPKPITCITAAAPRVGDWNFLWAFQVLEQQAQLRSCRIINDQDIIPLMPWGGYYHAGFQVRLYRGNDNDHQQPPQVTYPKLQDDWYSRWSRTLGNSLFVNLNYHYDHSDYRERIDQNQMYLEQLDLNQLYQQEELTGWHLNEGIPSSRVSI